MAKTPASEPAASDDKAAATPSVQSTATPTLEAKLLELDNRMATLDAQLRATTVIPSADAALVEQQNQRIAELQRMIGNLGERMALVQAVNARDEQFNAAVRSVEAAAAAIQKGVVPGPILSDAGTRAVPGGPCRECGCGPCECVSCDCCTFEVWMSHVRVDHMQIEVTDTNTVPTDVMEVWMFATIDPIHSIGVCIPDPSPLSALLLHKQLTDPYGPWVPVNRCVGTVTVKRGVPLTVPLTLYGVERETALERALPPGNRDEWGSATESLTFDCCHSNYSPVQIPVPLTSWGQGGGAISGRFIVVKKC